MPTTKLWTTAEFAAGGGGAEKTLPEWADEIAAGGGADAETIRDTIAAALVAGSGITITPNDGADTITVAATGGGVGDIDALPAADAVQSADIFHGSQSGADKKVTAAQIATYTGGAGGSGLNLAGMALATLLTLTSAVAAPALYAQVDGVHYRVEASVIANFVARDAFDYVTTKECGWIGDGAVHPLSERYATLGEAQAVYPFVTALTQQIDWAACKKASNECFGADLEIIGSYGTVTGWSDSSHIIVSTAAWTVNEHAGKTAFIRFPSTFVMSMPIVSNTATILTLAAAMPFGFNPADYGGDIDYAIGYGENGSNTHINKRLYCSAGTGQFAGDVWRIRNLAGGHIEGAGRRNTIFKGNTTVIQFDGIWYTDISCMTVECSTGLQPGGAFELDGRSIQDVAWQPYVTRGVQGITLHDMLIDGGDGLYALSMCRQGSSSGQGSECLFSNIHLQRASFACYYQLGFNALANKFLGGNIQSFSKNGIYVEAGTISIDTTGFQSTYGYAQYENDGWDIHVGSSGAYEGVPIYGCRTESMRFLKNNGAVSTDVRACVGNIAMNAWYSDQPYGPVAALGKAIIANARVWVATTPGTSHATTEPVWSGVADGGTIVDGTITWTETLFDVVEVGPDAGHSYDKNSCHFSAGRIRANVTSHRQETITTDLYKITTLDILCVDCTAAAKTVYLPDPLARRGRPITVKKTDTSANTLTVERQGAGVSFEGGATTYVIAGGSRGFATFVWGDFSPGGTQGWMIISSG